MSYATDPRVDEAKAFSMPEVVHRLGVQGLRDNSGELIGPCPLCGGRDRFGINKGKKTFLCRKCDIRGGDTIALVMAVLGMKFPDALTFLCGDQAAVISQDEIDARRDRARRAEQEQADKSAQFRRWAIAKAVKIWNSAERVSGGPLFDYLRGRGFGDAVLSDLPKAIRFLPDHPYIKKVGGENVTMHRGPCMIAGILTPGNVLGAVHRTWINPEPPFGKAVISHGGEKQPAKLVIGSKKGGAIRLTSRCSSVLIMGEGIETTLSAFAADPIEGADYWAGVDLGNMSGKMQRVPGVRYSGLPDLSDRDAFVPPPWVTRLIYIQDGDSEEKMTRAKLTSGLQRAMAFYPGLRAQIVRAGQGIDLNDLLLSGASK
ncbi:DUF7146 domain-containing protein [Planktotalea sp.]|uniref:DUF7146 domain-containing protein n=1 Tax=Planktotalea sp. TaxID=2029877 RepID=UPI003D6B31B7